ncbi:transcriptional regulator Spx [Salicibibacter cibi]|uniref:Transcriptional regulator Spx n=1 Tax=Salicibibacter cibi TaxID=2743001 RepID=A0A7T7CFF9_9BACI|nr:Spx/MgsR family RNA polymerase-binding regulatory protein [Salicibibacter cibi]QQK80059.1 transcriptional regulator Spx [Salicibibacter cibi]
MLKIYTSASCTSCRKAKQWLQNYQIPFMEIDVSKTRLSMDEVVQFFQFTENGVADIVSKHSKSFKELHLDMDELTTNTLFTMVANTPTLLKRPIMVDDQQMQVGYHEEEIRSFLPRAERMHVKG